jgi:hypothetical protein
MGHLSQASCPPPACKYQARVPGNNPASTPVPHQFPAHFRFSYQAHAPQVRYSSWPPPPARVASHCGPPPCAAATPSPRLPAAPVSPVLRGRLVPEAIGIQRWEGPDPEGTPPPWVRPTRFHDVIHKHVKPLTAITHKCFSYCHTHPTDQ